MFSCDVLLLIFFNGNVSFCRRIDNACLHLSSEPRLCDVSQDAPLQSDGELKPVEATY